MYVVALLVRLLVFSPSGELPADLENSVRGYWMALAAGQKLEALQYVAEESRTAFLTRTEIPILGWSLKDIEAFDSRHARSTVEVRCLIAGAELPFQVIDDWSAVGGKWCVNVPNVSPEQLNDLLFGLKEAIPGSPVFEIIPRPLKIHFLNTPQRATAFLRNGSSSLAEVGQIRFSTSDLRVVSVDHRLEAGATGRLVVDYLGHERHKELRASGELELAVGGERKTLSFSILYNHVSPALRAFYGLTPAEADRLEKGARLTPVVQP